MNLSGLLDFVMSWCYESCMTLKECFFFCQVRQQEPLLWYTTNLIGNTDNLVQACRANQLSCLDLFGDFAFIAIMGPLERTHLCCSVITVDSVVWKHGSN